jgi:1-deoxy-D-xylulose-5-phosphate reductoisomerase
VLHAGAEGLRELARLPEADMVLIAIVGTEGLQPALDAIEAGKDLAVASKEILVMAGELVMKAAREAGVKVLPVDSEHNAIFQCLEGNAAGPPAVRRLVLTASGGPFRTASAESLRDVTPEQALNHPTWKMGPKITIDSATLFNKGLEMIEARWLFGVEMDRVDVVVHPQSIVHSMVEFVDGSVLAQLSTPDMCFPIQYAVTWPDRVEHSLKPLDFASLARLDFEEPRVDDFPALRLAREAGNRCGTLPAVMNAANEVAVDAFLKGGIAFPRIWGLVEEVMNGHEVIDSPSLDDLLVSDREARAAAEQFMRGIAN